MDRIALIFHPAGIIGFLIAAGILAEQGIWDTGNTDGDIADILICQLINAGIASDVFIDELEQDFKPQAVIQRDVLFLPSLINVLAINKEPG